MKQRSYNFGAGPAALPEAILLEAQAELLNWKGQGMSILEIGHRTPEFQQLLQDAEADLRALLVIPNNYHILFLGGAARTQFAMVPLNLIQPGQQAAYLISGVWSEMAYDECSKIAPAYCLASSKDNGFKQTPDLSQLAFRENTAYVYYTPNETINGVRFSEIPETGTVPLIADMTSCILSEPLDVTKFGMIFAGAQKNIAPAGLTLVIIRDDLLMMTNSNPSGSRGQAAGRSELPTMFDYRTHVTHKSLYATPPVFNCYMAGLMFKWIKAQGGVDALYNINCKKAAALYHYIDASSFYSCGIEKNARSLMNVCFSLSNPALENEFLIQAERCGLAALKGHRMVGGLRASIYNAMPMDGVEALIAFMQRFAQEYA